MNTATGYATNITTAGATENVNQNASAVLGAPTTINSLRLAPGAAVNLSGANLTITSGAILNTGSTAFANTISANVTANNQELVLISTNGSSAGTGLLMNGVISGTGGLTRTGNGVVFINGANTYTGATYLQNGTTVVAGGTVTADGSAASVFGQDTSAINLTSSGSAVTRLWTSGNLTINRNLNVLLSGSSILGIGTAGNSVNESLTINGNIALSNPTNSTTNGFLFMEGGVARSQAVTVNGVISGNGGLRGSFAGYTILNGANTYTGGTQIGGALATSGTGVATQVVTETWEIGNDSAFGTGPIFFQSATFATQPIPGIGTLVAGNGPRTLNNRVVLATGFANFAGSNPITFNGSFELNGGAANASVLNLTSAAAPVTINGVVSHGSLVKMGPGTLTLNGANTYSGTTTVREGVLSVSSIGNGGVAGNIGSGLATSGYLVLAGNAVGNTGVLRYTGAGESTNRLFTITGSGGTIDASGTGALVFSNTGAITSTNFNQFTGATFVANAGVISVGTTNGGIFVVGSVLSGNANFAAGTTITEVGANYIRLSNATINGAQVTGQTFNFTSPATMTSRVLTLTGSNTGLNTLAPLVANVANFTTSLVKSGTGTWQLTNANTYTAGTTISGGALLVNNTTGSGTGTGAVTVGNTGTLGGTGAISGAVTVQNGGTLSPGNSPGVLTVNNNVTMNAGSTFFVDLNGATPGNAAGNHDQLVITGAANTLTLDLSGAGVMLTGSVGFTPTNLDVLRIVDNQSNNAIVGTFAGLAEGATVSFGPSWTAIISYIGGTGNDITLSSFAPVPEPGSAALVAAAAAVWFVRRRRGSNQ